ncbi:MAG: hypothetical protein PVI44_12905 [Balneolaceae bacterium]
MGRAMLIICAGLLVSLAVIGVSTADRGKQLTQKSVNYVQKVAATNAAHTAIQIAMQKISDDSMWVANHENTPVPITVDGAKDTLYVKYLNDYQNNNFWENDSLQIISEATLDNKYKATVRSVYLVSPFSNLVPPFKSALTIATNQVSPFNTSGSAAIKGAAPTGSGCSDKPAVTIAPPKGSGLDSTSYVSELNNIETSGTQKVSVDQGLTYQPTDQLIDRLKDSPDTKYLPAGSYKGSLGTKENPGVFFLENDTKLTGGINEGYGIMVVKSDGFMSYADTTNGGTLDIAGNFTFNGLVIFENAYNLDGKGTPTINGSVLIGNTTNYTNNIAVDINGNLTLQYDCTAEEYAKKSAATAIKQNKYSRVVTLENTTILK